MSARPLTLAVLGLLVTPGVLFGDLLSAVAPELDPVTAPSTVTAPEWHETSHRAASAWSGSSARSATSVLAPADGEVVRRQVAFTPVGDKPVRAGAGMAGPSPTVVATTDEVPLGEPLAVIGASWREGEGDGVVLQYRLKVDGQWGPWESSDSQDAKAPAEEEPEEKAPVEEEPEDSENAAAPLRDGSDAIPVAGAEAVRARLVGPTGLPNDARLSVIEPSAASGDGARVAQAVSAGVALDRSVAAATSRAVSGTGEAGAVTFVSVSPAVSVPVLRPPVRSRVVWRADENATASSRPMSRAVGFSIHHTAGTNTYTQQQVPAILRGIHNFHTADRGWRDIGYNYLVDQWGGVWEGRRGSRAGTPRGAHTAGHNNQLVGISLLGDYNKAEPSKAALERISRIVAWKSRELGINPAGRITVSGKRQFTVVGHRDVGSTSCPGTNLYAKLPQIRERAAELAGANS